MVTKVTVLEREVYSEAEAARLLAVSQGTLHYWLDGGERRGVTYLPVLRPWATGRRILTWGEFVEAGLLRAYREKSIPMRELREFISTLRHELDEPYPLATRRPWVARGAGLVLKAQSDSNLPEDFWLFSTGQLMTPWGSDFLERIAWDEQRVALSYRPHDTPGSPIAVNPLVRFGRPAIRGISTSAIFEESRAGASVEEVAETYGLSTQEVYYALEYEGTKAA